MMDTLILIISAVVLFLAVTLGGYFLALPLAELRRQSRRGDEKARLRYEVARSPVMVRITFGGLATLAFLTFAIQLSYQVSFTTALLVLVAALLLARIFYVRNKIVQPIALFLAPYIVRLFVFVRPVLRIFRRPLARLFTQPSNAVLYRKSDVVTYLQSQKNHTENIARKEELDRAIRSLQFSDAKVSSYMTRASDIRFVASDEPVSPILMHELHETGWVEFPVFLDKKKNVVGRLRLSDLVERKLSGQVFNAMQADVQYISADNSLLGALQNFTENRQQLQLVQDENGKVIGAIDPVKLIEQLLF